MSIQTSWLLKLFLLHILSQQQKEATSGTSSVLVKRSREDPFMLEGNNVDRTQGSWGRKPSCAGNSLTVMALRQEEVIDSRAVRFSSILGAGEGLKQHFPMCRACQV